MFFLAVYSERERERERELKRQLVTLVSKFGRKPALSCQLYVVTPPWNSFKKKRSDEDRVYALFTSRSYPRTTEDKYGFNS